MSLFTNPLEVVETSEKSKRNENFLGHGLRMSWQKLEILMMDSESGRKSPEPNWFGFKLSI